MTPKPERRKQKRKYFKPLETGPSSRRSLMAKLPKHRKSGMIVDLGTTLEERFPGDDPDR